MTGTSSARGSPRVGSGALARVVTRGASPGICTKRAPARRSTVQLAWIRA
jgi:hypothetical protein